MYNDVVYMWDVCVCVFKEIIKECWFYARFYPQPWRFCLPRWQYASKGPYANYACAF